MAWEVAGVQSWGQPMRYDDAFITYRYATNVAHAGRFVFNLDDAPVLGTSTPLYTFLLAIGAKCGADIPVLSLYLGGIATMMTAGLLVLPPVVPGI